MIMLCQKVATGYSKLKGNASSVSSDESLKFNLDVNIAFRTIERKTKQLRDNVALSAKCGVPLRECDGIIKKL